MNKKYSKLKNKVRLTKTSDGTWLHFRADDGTGCGINITDKLDILEDVVKKFIAEFHNLIDTIEQKDKTRGTK